MLVNLKRFNGNTLNVSGIRAAILNPGMVPNANPVFVEQAMADQDYSGAYSVSVREVAIQLRITDPANRHARMVTIKNWFKRGTSGTLEATFVDDSLDYLLNCVVMTPPIPDEEFPDVFTVILQTGDSSWRELTPHTDTWTVTGTGGTKTVDAGTGDETALIASLTATANPTVGYLYHNIYRLVDVPVVNYGTRPWCLTVDTATLVGGGKMQADCDDLRIMLDGKQTKRWIAAPNTATTNIWFNVALGPGYSLILDTAIAATGDITTMTFTKTTANLAALKALPTKGILYNGTEWISWNGKTVNKYQLKGIKRRIYGTTWQAHATSSTFKYIQHTIVMKYGNSAVGAPSLTDANYDINKPQFDLTASSNSAWVYTASTLFYDRDYPNKGGSWTPVLNVLGDESKYYMIKEDVESGDPAMGAKLSCWQKQGRDQTEKGRVGWMLKCAGGFYRVTLAGRKKRSTARWPTFAGLQRSLNGKTWVNVWTDAKPATTAWTALATHTTVSITTTNKYIFFGIDGTITVLANAYAMLEGLTATIEFYSTNLPTGAFLGESSNFSLEIALENQTTGDIVYLDYPMITTKVFLLDSENSVATFDEQNMHDAMTLNDEGRSVWLRLAKGVNTLALTSADCGTLDIALTWYRRRL